jgi:hypothetical protein
LDPSQESFEPLKIPQYRNITTLQHKIQICPRKIHHIYTSFLASIAAGFYLRPKQLGEKTQGSLKHLNFQALK